MPDVFLSYRRADKDKAHALAKALRIEGLDVWWDADLDTGETFDTKVQKLLHEEAKAVIVLWSATSVKSEWVRAEASVGRERGILVPVMVRRCVVPVPFNVLQTADLTGWSGDRAHPVYRNVVKQTKELTGKTHVKPLKPPPNPALRSLWRAIAAVAVLAAIGASTWLLKPWTWEAFDPAARAKAERDSSIARLAAFGIQPGDLEVFDWKAIAKKRLEPDSFDALKLEADSGNTVAQAVLCAAAYWGTPTREPDDQLAFTNCRLSAEAGEAAGQVYYGYLLEERSRYISGETEEEKERKRTLSADASEQFRKASEQGFGWGQLEYGARLLSGEGGVATDPARAAELYRSAQAKQMPAADYAMAELVSMGYLANNSARWTEAARLYRAAADKGFPPAMYELADMLRDGRGIPEDLEAALALYRQAAAQDDNEAVADRARSQVDYHERKKAEAAEAAATPPP